MAYEARAFAGNAAVTALTAQLAPGGLSLAITADTGTNYPSGGNFYIVVDTDLSTEEKILCSGATASAITVVTGGRGQDGTADQVHTLGAPVEHCLTSIDLSEANRAVNKTIGQVTAVGDLLVGDALNSLNQLAAGANNTVLVADSAIANVGLKYSTLAAASLASDSVIEAKILDGAVTVNKIGAGAVVAAKLGALAVTTAKIDTLAVTTAKIAAGAVTPAEIANDAVTTVKILDANVTAGKLATDAVTSVKILADAVTTVKVLDANVTTNKIADANVTTVKIADSAVTAIKIPNLEITQAKMAYASGVIYRFANATAATTAITSPETGMQYWDQALLTLNVYNGTAWVCVTPASKSTPAATSRTNTAYGDLAAGAHSVSILTGTKALVTWNATAYNSVESRVVGSVAVSGATTIAAGTVATTSADLSGIFGVNKYMPIGGHWYYASLTAGINTFTLQWKTYTGTVHIENYSLSVVAIP